VDLVGGIFFSHLMEATEKPPACEPAVRAVYRDGTQVRGVIKKLRHSRVGQLGGDRPLQQQLDLMRALESGGGCAGGGHLSPYPRNPGESEAVQRVADVLQHQRRHALVHVEAGGRDREQRRGGRGWVRHPSSGGGDGGVRRVLVVVVVVVVCEEAGESQALFILGATLLSNLPR
jgi:hypothetical protein